MISHRQSLHGPTSTARAIPRPAVMALVAVVVVVAAAGCAASAPGSSSAAARPSTSSPSLTASTAATGSTSETPAPVVSAAVPSALVGRWYQHDGLLVVKADGTFTWSASAGVSAPTATVDGTVHGIGPATASGKVTSSTQSQRIGRAITLTVDQSHDTITLTGPGASPSGAPILPFCGPSAPSGYCGA